MVELVKLTIDGKEVEVPKHYTVLKAAEKLGIFIPRLCYLEGIHEESNCRVCVVEIDGQRTLKNSCQMTVSNGMVVRTNTERVNTSVVQNLELLAANHKFECWRCSRKDNCELLDLMERYEVDNVIGEDPCHHHKAYITNDESCAIVLDSSKCILCGRCISACQKLSGTGVLAFNNRGSETIVGPAGLVSMEDAGCIYCGKCIQVCPTAAIREKSEIQQVEDALRDPSKYVVVQAAPAVRAALGEEFNLPIGTNTEGKMYAAFRALGFDDIADTNFGADLTILEEGTEFLHRLKDGGPFPMFTSCSPGWVRYLEIYQDEKWLPHLSTAKSPHQMTGAVIKHYYAEKINRDKKDVVVVSIMPCIAKKFEKERPEMQHDGVKDVDYVLTTRELARMIKRNRIDFNGLQDLTIDGPLAQYTGAAPIFGATGGVMEAALRTVVEKLTGEKLTKVEFEAVRGVENIKEAELEVAGTKVRVAVVHGASAIKEFFEMLEAGKADYHFVEFMGCTGGCVNGGGQPIIPANLLEKIDVRVERAKVLYNQDKDSKLRKSHESNEVAKLYEDFLGEPCGHLSHELLHTHYVKREIYTQTDDSKIINKNPQH